MYLAIFQCLKLEVKLYVPYVCFERCTQIIMWLILYPQLSEDRLSLTWDHRIVNIICFYDITIVHWKFQTKPNSIKTINFKYVLFNCFICIFQLFTANGGVIRLFIFSNKWQVIIMISFFFYFFFYIPAQVLNAIFPHVLKAAAAQSGLASIVKQLETTWKKNGC